MWYTIVVIDIFTDFCWVVPNKIKFTNNGRVIEISCILSKKKTNSTEEDDGEEFVGKI